MLDSSQGNHERDAHEKMYEEEYRQVFHMPPYTAEEQAVFDKQSEPATIERLVHIIHCLEIDIRRYDAQVTENPDEKKKVHFERLRESDRQAIYGWIKTYGEVYDIFLPGTVVSYDGTEDSASLPKAIQHTTDEERSSLPA